MSEDAHELFAEQWKEVYADLAHYEMPFGRYEGRLLVNLPEEYLMWFQGKGFPQGRLGELMQFVYEIKMSGAEEVFDKIRRGGR